MEVSMENMREARVRLPKKAVSTNLDRTYMDYLASLWFREFYGDCSLQSGVECSFRFHNSGSGPALNRFANNLAITHHLLLSVGFPPSYFLFIHKN
jgi:hypothetical protein